jgi:hypothetical protein
MEIIYLKGKFIKSEGIGRIHAMQDGSWQGRIFDRDVHCHNEDWAVEYFANAVALAAISGGK